MRVLYYWIRFSQFMRHPLGLARFAELCLTSCLREYAAVKSSAATAIHRLKERVKALENEREALDPATAPSFEWTLKNARQLRFERLLWWVLLLAEAALNYYAALIFLPGRGLLLESARLFVSLIATGAAVVVAEKFIDEFLATPVSPEERTLSRRRAWGWGGLLALLEIAVWGIASTRARDMEGAAHHSAMLYVGLVVLSLALAPTAGGVAHDAAKRYPPVRRAKRLYAIADELEECAKQLQTARHALEAKWDAMVRGFYNRFADFRVVKENRNAKRQVVEDTTDAYFNTHDDFCFEARKQRDAMFGEAELLTDEPPARAQTQRPLALEFSPPPAKAGASPAAAHGGS